MYNVADSDRVMAVMRRKKIFDYVVANPGTHLRKVAHDCKIALGTTKYHLDRLEDGEYVAARRDGRYKRYFQAGSLGRLEREVMNFLRHKVPCRILEWLIVTRLATQHEMSFGLGVSRSTVSFHLGNLVKAQVLRRINVRPENQYEIVNVDVVRALLERFGKSLEAASDYDPNPAKLPDPPEPV